MLIADDGLSKGFKIVFNSSEDIKINLQEAPIANLAKNLRKNSRLPPAEVSGCILCIHPVLGFSIMCILLTWMRGRVGGRGGKDSTVEL